MKLRHGKVAALVAAVAGGLVVGAYWCLSLQVLHARLLDSPRPMLGSNAQHQGFLDTTGPLSEPQILWETRPGLAGGAFSVGPSLDEDGNLYLSFGSSTEDNLVSYDPQGKERWRFRQHPSRSGLSVPLLADVGMVLKRGDVILGFRDSRVRSLSRSKGTLNWEVQLSTRSRRDKGIISSAVMDRKGALYVGGREPDGFVKLHPRGGRVLWRAILTDGLNSSSPALSTDEKTVYFGRGDIRAAATELQARNTSDGTLKWKYEETGANFGWCSPVVGADGTIYQSDPNQGRLYAFADRVTSCEKLWVFSARRSGGAPRLPCIGDDALYFGTGGPDPLLIAVGLDGREKWHHEFSGATALSSPLVTRNAVFIAADQDGRVHCLEKTGGRLLWSKQVAQTAGRFAESLAMGEGGILYVGTDGTPRRPGEAVLVAIK
jgi:outer membrane protein assembly factor BamB